MKHARFGIKAIVTALIAGCMSFAGSAVAQTAQVTVDVDKPGIAVSKMLYGVFFEEINRAGDGGLYAEMIQNRSFEDAQTLPVAWELQAAAGSQAASSLDRTMPLNSNNRTSLRLDVQSVAPAGRVAIVNRGFVGSPRNHNETDKQYADRIAKEAAQQRGHGIAVKAGADYLASLYVRGNSASSAPLTLTLEKGDGTIVASGRISGITDQWKKIPVFLKAQSDASDARLVLSAAQPGTYFVDMVSLFPKETFMGRPNGLRKDLADKVKAMKPAFMRFPGGCFVEGDTLANAVRWKETIGDVAERPGRYNLWGYRSTDGLGMFEYLQFCEDIGAEPLFVINCGMSHKGNVPMNEMAAWVQDALDAIEYCNGPASSTWGAKRAAAGHPKPFNLKYIEIGNENGGPIYNERFALFVDAIKSKYPDIQIIANVWGGVPTNRPYELKDEHYYDTPSWFLAHADHYDKYPRTGAKVYVGEYAVTRNCGLGNLAAAIGEAAFMIGMERNSDIVHMASYAPLFAEPNWKRWNPNAINFNGSRTYGTPSYHLQTMFANNVPDVIVPIAVAQAKFPDVTPHGRIGIGTWRTQSEFKDIEVFSPTGQSLWRADPAQGLKQFTLAGGNWEVIDGAFRQTSQGSPAKAFAGDETWGDCTLRLKARKISGEEGFLVSFYSTDPTATSWWNLGGWGNKLHGVETPEIKLTQTAGTIETGRWYDIRIELRGHQVTCYLDDQKIQDVRGVSTHRLYAGAGIDRAGNDVVIKAVNPTPFAVTTTFDLKGAARITSAGRALVLSSGDLKDENSLENPEKVIPRESRFEAGKQFTYTLPARSVSVLRVGMNR